MMGDKEQKKDYDVIVDCFDDLAKLKLCLNSGVDVNQYSPCGDTALITAIKGKRFYVSKLLMEHGADTNLIHKREGYAPIYYTCGLIDISTFKCLVEHGADINLQYDGYESYFQCAVRYQNYNLIREFVLNYNFDINDECNALYHYSISNDANNRWVMLNTLIELGVDFNKPNLITRSGDTFLFLSEVSDYYFNIVKQLNTMPQYRVRNEKRLKENNHIVQVALNNGADPFITNDRGEMPNHPLCVAKRYEIERGRVRGAVVGKIGSKKKSGGLGRI